VVAFLFNHGDRRGIGVTRVFLPTDCVDERGLLSSAFCPRISLMFSNRDWVGWEEVWVERFLIRNEARFVLNRE